MLPLRMLTSVSASESNIVVALMLMNEIPAGVAGVIKEILVKNGEPVEFGQPLCRIALE